MSSLGLQNVGALDSRKIVSLISERMRTSRISIFNYVWIVFLVIQVSFTARGLTPIFSFPQSTWLSIIASAVINYLLVFLVLLIFHSSNNILGDIGHHKKTKQHLIGFSAILVGLALYLIVTVTYLRFWYLDWLFEIYILVTFFISYFGIFIVLPFWGRSYIKSIGKCAQALMIVEAHSIIQDLNNQRFSDKFVRGSIIRRNNRFWLYFDAFILNCDMPEEKTYLVFLEPAARFFDIQHKSRHSFNRDILLKSWRELLEILERKTSQSFKPFLNEPAYLEKYAALLNRNRVVKFLDSSILFGSAIEYIFPHLKSLWDTSSMPLKEIPVGRIKAKSLKIKEILRDHLKHADKYDLIVAGNKIIAFFTLAIIYSLFVWLSFIISIFESSREFNDVQPEFLRLLITLGALYLFTNSGLRIMQRGMRSRGINYIVSPRFHRVRRYFYLGLMYLSIFFVLPSISGLAEKIIIPNSSQIFWIINLLSLYILLATFQTPRRATIQFSDSLLTREFLRLLNLLEKSKTLSFKIGTLQRLRYCKRLFQSYRKKLQDLGLDQDGTKVFVDSVSKYLGQISYSLSLGSNQARSNARKDIAIVTRSVATGDLRVIQEQIQDIDLYVKEGLRLPQKSFFAQIIYLLETSRAFNLLVVIIIWFLLNKFVDSSVWDVFSKWSDIMQLLSR